MSDENEMNKGFNAEALEAIIQESTERTDLFMIWLNTNYKVQYPQVSLKDIKGLV